MYLQRQYFETYNQWLSTIQTKQNGFMFLNSSNISSIQHFHLTEITVSYSDNVFFTLRLQDFFLPRSRFLFHVQTPLGRGSLFYLRPKWSQYPQKATSVDWLPGFWIVSYCRILPYWHKATFPIFIILLDESALGLQGCMRLICLVTWFLRMVVKRQCTLISRIRLGMDFSSVLPAFQYTV